MEQLEKGIEQNKYWFISHTMCKNQLEMEHQPKSKHPMKLLKAGLGKDFTDRSKKEVITKNGKLGYTRILNFCSPKAS